MKKSKRCAWCTDEQIYMDYHDDEWGVPVYDDQVLFEFLILEGAQAGLSWITVLKKRENYRKLMHEFNPEKIARYSDAKIEKLLMNPGIIRNRLKVTGAVQNAKIYLQLVEQEKSFSDYLWGFVDGTVKQNRWTCLADLPASTPESEAMSKDLKKRGFKFVGPTICYAFMQAVGMVNDHTVDCFRFKELQS